MLASIADILIYTICDAWITYSWKKFLYITVKKFPTYLNATQNFLVLDIPLAIWSSYIFSTSANLNIKW